MKIEINEDGTHYCLDVNNKNLVTGITLFVPYDNGYGCVEVELTKENLQSMLGWFDDE